VRGGARLGLRLWWWRGRGALRGVGGDLLVLWGRGNERCSAGGG